jgi:hypothetical protein
VRVEPYGAAPLRAERIYARRVADGNGKPLMREDLAFLKGAKALSDTRLGPGEKRSETFTFEVPAAMQTQVRAIFWYHYSPLARTEAQPRITFLTLNRLVQPATRRGKRESGARRREDAAF